MQLATAYPVRLVCRMLGLPRSSFYYQPWACAAGQLKAAIEEGIATWPTYGYRRVTAQIRRDKQWIVNGKCVRRLMQERGLQAKVRSKRRRTTDSQHDYPRDPNLVQNLEVVRPDQAWGSDITDVRLLMEFVYLAVIMDVTRAIRGWHLARNLGHGLTWTALQRAMAAGHQPEIHHSDQGVQCAATAYVETLQAHGVAISMAEVGAAWQNGDAERLVRTIKEEEMDLSE